MMHVSENQLRRHNHGPEEYNMNSIFLSQKVFAAARVTDSTSGQKSNKQKFNDVLRDDPNAIDITYKKKASSMYKNSLKNLPKNH